MSGHKPWNEISAKVRSDPERRARIEQREQAKKACGKTEYARLYHTFAIMLLHRRTFRINTAPASKKAVATAKTTR